MVTASAPRLSLLTVSTGRARLLLAKLEAVAGQRPGPAQLEVVVVDNACPERVGDAVERGSWPFALRVVRTGQREPAARARCLAVSAATAPLVWLTDDDCLPAADAAARHLARQGEGPCVAIGSVRFVEDRRVRTWRPRRVGPAQLAGANASLPRVAMLRACRTRPRLPRAYGGEDVVLGLQLRDQGLPFVAVPEAAVDHHGPDPTRGADPSKAFDAGYNAVVIAHHWPDAAWMLGVHPTQLALKRLLFWSPEAVVWRRLRPGRLRYERAYLAGSRAARHALVHEAGA
jgi:hypothetical protein